MIHLYNLDQKEKNPKKEFLAVILVVVILGSIALGLRKYRNNLLEDNKEVIAKITEKQRTTYGPKQFFVKFVLGSDTISSQGFQRDDCYSKLKVGDSIRIKYSVESPTVVDIIDCKPLNRNTEWD